MDQIFGCKTADNVYRNSWQSILYSGGCYLVLS